MPSKMMTAGIRVDLPPEGPFQQEQSPSPHGTARLPTQNSSMLMLSLAASCRSSTYIFYSFAIGRCSFPIRLATVREKALRWPQSRILSINAREALTFSAGTVDSKFVASHGSLACTSTLVSFSAVQRSLTAKASRPIGAYHLLHRSFNYDLIYSSVFQNRLFLRLVSFPH